MGMGGDGRMDILAEEALRGMIEVDMGLDVELLPLS